MNNVATIKTGCKLNPNKRGLNEISNENFPYTNPESLVKSDNRDINTVSPTSVDEVNDLKGLKRQKINPVYENSSIVNAGNNLKNCENHSCDGSKQEIEPKIENESNIQNPDRVRGNNDPQNYFNSFYSNSDSGSDPGDYGQFIEIEDEGIESLCTIFSNMSKKPEPQIKKNNSF